MTLDEIKKTLKEAFQSDHKIDILDVNNYKYSNLEIADLNFKNNMIWLKNNNIVANVSIEDIKSVFCKENISQFTDPNPVNDQSLANILKNIGDSKKDELNVEQEYSPQEQLIIEKCDDLKELLIRKNRDYGNSAEKSFNKWGHKAFMIRIEDKMNRLENLIKNGENNLIKDESLYDTVLDLAGYELLWLVEMSKKENKKND